jgi:nucleoside-diphosphate-sugar epimerase
MTPPGGVSVAYVDGVADAHLAAAERGRSGERYILSDGYVSIRDLCLTIARCVPGTRVPPVAPEWLMHLLAGILEPSARLFSFTPLIAGNQLEFLLWEARANSEKAQRELGFAPMPLSEGVERTVRFLQGEKLVPGL